VIGTSPTTVDAATGNSPLPGEAQDPFLRKGCCTRRQVARMAGPARQLNERMSVAMRSAVRASVVAATVAAVVVPFSAPALAHESDHSPTVEVLSTSVFFPFQIAVGRGGVSVADGGTSKVTKLPDLVVATGPTPGEVAGVALGEKGQLAFTTTSYATGSTTLTIQRPGKADVVADLSGFEQTKNPDQDVSYGVRNPSECVTKALEGMDAPVSYTGQVDSHPYLSLIHI
jgi:hypothetical protein